MNYHPKGMRIWDTWYINRNGEIHAFYLQRLRPGSTRTEREADSIGHAVSRNLLDWIELPNVLEPGEPGSGEDMCLFTGCAYEKDGRCYLYYTMRDSRDGGSTQQIGLAVSDDFMHFEKYKGNPVIVPDGRYYCNKNHPARYGIVDCRDLVVVKSPDEKGFYGFYASRQPSEEMPEGAVIACVYSEDLLHWTHLPPVFASDKYTIVEVPDVFFLEGKWYLTMLVNNDYGSRDLFEDPLLAAGTIYAVSDTITGPYQEEKDNIILASMENNGISCRSLDFEGKRHLLYTMTERDGECDSGDVLMGSLSTPKEYRIIEGKLRAVYSDLLNSKLKQDMLTEQILRTPVECRLLYETPAQWEYRGGVFTGKIRTCWNRYTFGVQAESFVYSTAITVTSGVAAGLAFKQSACGYKGYVLMLDIEKQRVSLCNIPQMKLLDSRAFPLAHGRQYQVTVVSKGIFYEVYIDGVLLLHTTSYYAKTGYMGLFLDRAEATFSHLHARELDIENGAEV